MTLSAQMASDAATFLDTDDFGESVTYTPAGGEASSISAVVEKEDAFQEAYVRGEGFATAVLHVKVSDVDSPQHGDTFTISGKTWELDPLRGVIEEDAAMLQIAIRRRETG